MSDFTDHYFDFDDITLHYVEAGSGPLVIFYHGFPLFWFSFHHQMTALKDHYRVVAVDGLGVNLSSEATNLEKYKLEDLAAQLDALANHLAPGEPFHWLLVMIGGVRLLGLLLRPTQIVEKVIGINAPPTNQLLHLLQTNEEQRKRSSYMWLMRETKTHILITENGARRLWKETPMHEVRGLPTSPRRMMRPFARHWRYQAQSTAALTGTARTFLCTQDLEEAECWPSPTASTPVPALLTLGQEQTLPLWLNLLMS